MINGKTVFEAMKRGDKTAKKVVQQYINNISIGLLSITSIFQPEKICIGGGISNEGESLLLPIRKYIAKQDQNNDMSDHTEICVAKLGENAGIIGAAFLDRLV